MHRHYKLEEFRGYHLKNKSLWKVTKMNLATNGVTVTELRYKFDMKKMQS